MRPIPIKRRLHLVVAFLIIAGCTGKIREEVKVLHEGSFTVKARFVDGRRDGKTEVYDISGKLTGILTYKNDSFSGICIHYFPSGKVSDSVMYVCDKPHGYWRFYTEDSDPRQTTYFYYGLQFGPDIWYRKDRILKAFRFLNFERDPIVECTYNTHGNLDSIEKMDLKVMLTEKVKDLDKVVEFFAYLPKIPLTEDFYSIGIADKNHVKQKLCDIEGSNFLIDTVLAAPPGGYHFYLRCDVKEDDGRLIGTYVVEMIKNEEPPKG